MRAAWPPAPPRVLTWLRFQRAKDWQVFAFRIGTDWITGPVPDSGTEWHVSTTGSAEVSPEMGVHFCSTRLGVYLQHFRLTLTVASEWGSALKVVRALPRITSNGTARVHALGDVNSLSRDAIEALPAAIYMTDAEGRITFYNEAAAELWGCRPELGESKFCGSWKLYWPDGTPLPHDECPMALALRQRRPIRGMEAVAERPDGTRIPFIPYPTPLFDKSGRLTGAVNMLVDISERKRTEARLAERNAQLDLAGKIARIGSFMYDHGTKKSQLSPGCAAIYGLPEGTLEISREDWRARVHPDDLPSLDAVVRRAFTNGEREFVLEFRIFRDGQVRWIEFA